MAEKTHRVRLSRGITYERHYPNEHPLVVRVPADTPVEITNETYESIKRMNDTPGRPTNEITRLADGEATELSVPEIIRAVEKDMASRGVMAGKKATVPMVQGKYAGLWAGAKGLPKEETAVAAADVATSEAATKKGGK